MKTHPEQRPDEIYMGNATREDVARSSWRTSRLGNTPLMADGSPLNSHDLRPWFIKRSEVEQAIRDENNADLIRVYESLLAEMEKCQSK